MSASRSAVGPERTRQQLQELDALLQQMLAMPPAEKPESRRLPAANSRPAPESEPPPVVEPKPADPPAVKRLKPLLAVSPPRESGERRVIAAKLPIPLSPESLRSPEEPVAAAANSAAKPGLSVFVPEEPPEARIETSQPGPPLTGVAADPLDPLRFDLAGPLAMDLAPDVDESAMFPSRDPEPFAESDQPSRLSLAHQSLIGVNRLLETPFAMLGPVGRPFLSHPGRNFLGWLGLILLTGSAALALGVWLGWTW